MTTKWDARWPQQRRGPSHPLVMHVIIVAVATAFLLVHSSRAFRTKNDNLPAARGATTRPVGTLRDILLPRQQQQQRLLFTPAPLFHVSDTNNDEYVDPNEQAVLECAAPEEMAQANDLKRELFQLGASYDRGFAATAQARTKVSFVINELERINPETLASRGITGQQGVGALSPLAGNWRMVWTTAPDVLILQASPIFTVGAIYQVFHPLPVVTNIIDFIPRLQSSLPPNGAMPSTLVRAKVGTRASPRPNLPNRIGLVFENVQVAPQEVLGMKVDVFPPLAFDLPKLPGVESNSENSPGYFDVTYLDKDLLIIRQNAPGGMFALVRTDTIDP